MFTIEYDYDYLIIQFDNLDYKIKNELSKKINLMKNMIEKFI